MMDKYLQGRWVEGGRDWPLVDCYGLVLEVRRDFGFPDWPEWGHARRGDGSMHEVGSEFVRTLEPCEPAPGVLVACYTGSLMTHVAVVVDDNGILSGLEINEGTGVTCRPLRRLHRLFVKVEYYR